MSQFTTIQWADSTVNPTMGCPGCEAYPSPTLVIQEIDSAVSAQLSASETSSLPTVSVQNKRRTTNTLPRRSGHSNPLTPSNNV
jgi:hypothetical protein